MNQHETSRRKFIRSGSALTGFFILPSGLRANSPNGRLNSAHIGTGGKGAVDTAQIAAHPKTQVVALCDVDRHSLEGRGRKQNAKGKERYPGSKKFQDYREMFAAMGDKIDIVSVSTPDHTHYPATMAAMKLGKHVYTQKPLTNNIAEARALMVAARENKVFTQMGIQNQSSIAYRTATHLIRSGLIGKISQVHVWSFKNWGYDGAPHKGEDPVPANLDWNLWLGTAPERAFLKGKYHTMDWRRYMDFGCGTLGDMGIHIFDRPFGSLDLKSPTWAKATCRATTGYGLPTKMIVRLGFSPTPRTTDDFSWTWYDGTYGPPENGGSFGVPADKKLPKQGAIFVGEGGSMLLGHIDGPRFFPGSVYDKLEKPDIPKKVNHYSNWIDVILAGKGEPTARFDYAAPLTESVLLGVIASRYPGKKIEWDSAEGKVTNFKEANRYVAFQNTRAF
ncbi:MAG TPA: Gfo/Idh/MocA family oxidoreductase [Verrucomicrobiales bacterium]|nr:Gfo/Idh/MocA family oxidoreductase [Verrucomicrobiales bacterium]